MYVKMLRYAAAMLFIFCLPSRAAPQDVPSKQFKFDGFVLSDSLEYKAETIDYFFDDRKVIMNNNASIHYVGRVIKSPVIKYYEKYDYMEAVGTVDSTGNYLETPSFTDRGSEELRGIEIKYNMNTGEGFINKGTTKFETGFYHSDAIKRVSEDTLFIRQGKFTTCDLEENPHFYFAGSKMKFIVNDKIIIKPITAYVNDIPIMWFPFYVYPIAKGRQSGFLTPRYGSSRRDGRYVANLGYYFAPSDYWDYRFAGVLREKNGWLLKNWYNYTGNNLSGSVFGSYEDRSSDGTKEWELQMSHRHTISPTLSMSGSGNFQSSDYSRYNSTNMYERLNRDLRSSMSLTKKWKKSGNSLSTTVSHHKNLDLKNTTVVLPSMRFRKQRKALFGGDDKKKKRRKYVKQQEEEAREPAWYENIYYSANASFNNTDKTINQSSGIESNKDEYTRDMSMSSSLSGSFKFLGWLVSEPSIQLSEQFSASNKYQHDESYRRNDNLSMKMGLGTTIYGTFTPSIGNLAGIRHVLTPSISYTYGKKRAFFAEDFDAFTRFDKNDLEDDRISSMNINVRNLIQMKTIKEEKENKFDLLRLNFSTGVDFEEDERKLSPLNTTLDFSPFKKFLSTRITASHDFYHDDDSFQLLSPYLRNVSITSNLGLSDTNLAFMGKSSREHGNSNLGRDDFALDEAFSEEGELSDDSDTSLPISLRFSHTYQIRRTSLTAPGKYKYKTTHNIKPTISLSPTKNFKLNYNIYYDIGEKSINLHRLAITRDLHCWEANISWIPSGVNEGYYFLVNIKELPDVKIEKRRGSTHQSY